MTTTHTLTLLAAQLAIPETRTEVERDQHLLSSARRVRESLSKQSADLVVLPELSSIEYSGEAFDLLDTLAEPLDGPSFNTWCEVAKEYSTHIVFGFPRVTDQGYTITSAVVGPDGNLIGYYDKIHLAQFGASAEKNFFVPGDGLLVFSVGGFTVAPIICVDIRTPEIVRELATTHQVDLILQCSAYFRDQSFYSWHPFVITRSVENQLFFLGLNRAGSNYGASIISYPWVDGQRPPYVFHDCDEQLLSFTLALQEIDDARRQYGFLGDRRSHYGLKSKMG